MQKNIAQLLVIIGFTMIFWPTSASAADDTASGSTVTISDFYLTFLVATLLPILVGIVRSRYGSSQLGAVLLLVFSVISGWLTSLYATGGEFEWKDAVVGVIVSLVTAAGTHYGFLKPAGVTGSDGAVQKLLPQGVGGHRADPPPA